MQHHNAIERLINQRVRRHPPIFIETKKIPEKRKKVTDSQAREHPPDLVVPQDSEEIRQREGMGALPEEVTAKEREDEQPVHGAKDPVDEAEEGDEIELGNPGSQAPRLRAENFDDVKKAQNDVLHPKTKDDRKDLPVPRQHSEYRDEIGRDQDESWWRAIPLWFI